ncbi:SAP30-binding protein [Mytilus edulis]|uniref:SAP30-binding protein n=1 Tax=Mytilus edulis TaxID=6550 RepID=A0A8S3TVF1_MYTED|nr:SAP30-binding protein [Mytilus edulis]
MGERVIKIPQNVFKRVMSLGMLVQKIIEKANSKIIHELKTYHSLGKQNEEKKRNNSPQNLILKTTLGNFHITKKRVDRTTSLNAEQASSLSRSMLNKSFDEIEIPPAPPGKCRLNYNQFKRISVLLQDKISGLFEKMRKGLDMNDKIQRRKDFRNPSIYEKLIEFIGIDEKGSNYPAEVFDPHAWGKESFYDQLDKAQKVEMEKREKERKDRTKVEFVTGTKRPQSSTDVTSGDDKKRKTKWDNQPTSNVTGSRGGLPGVINPNVVSGSASGTKSTVIPATGNITKKTK